MTLSKQELAKRAAIRAEKAANKPIKSEWEEQCEFVRWCHSHPTEPRLKLIYSHLNGMRASIGAAVKEKKAGATKGIPDLFLPVPAQGYHGLYIEMKRTEGGVASEAQKMWVGLLCQQGYAVAVCKGKEAAVTVTEQYLELVKN